MFKNTLLVFGLILAASSAYAADVSLTVGDVADLPTCGGSIEVKASGTNVNLILRNVKNCSNFDIVAAGGTLANYDSKKIPVSSNGRTGSFTIPMSLLNDGFNAVKISVQSNSGKTEDDVTVTFNETTALQIGDIADLPSCGGTIEVRESDNGSAPQYNLILKGIENCSNFDIVASNGMLSNYDNKKIPVQGGAFGGSFTIPSSQLGYGVNELMIVLKSNSGAHQDAFMVQINN